MKSSPPLKILIVDDSRIFRSAIEEGLRSQEDILVTGSVWNGIKALEFIRATPPDIVTLDIQMPDMDGLETLEAIQEINKSLPPDDQIGVIMLSSFTQKGADITVRALEMGAFDFIPKPEGMNIRENIQQLIQQLTVKIRQYRKKSLRTVPERRAAVRRPARKETRISPPPMVNALLIGVSTGGPKALGQLLPPLCERIDIPVFIVQHMPPTFTESLAKSLDAKCRCRVTEARHNETVLGKHVYIAPGGRHMEVARGRKPDEVRIRINDKPPLNGCRPSVDILFSSAAGVYGRNIIAVILTGMGSDGTAGSGILKNRGACILAQDEKTSVVWGMPGSVINAGLADNVVSLHDMAESILSLMK
jgi:two-component system chemotaxis response regulator CheB